MEKVINYLKSNAFGVKLLIGTVIVQAFHSYFIFYLLSPYDSEYAKVIQSVFYSFVLSSAILFYTLRNRKGIALLFAVFESGINLYYFIYYLYKIDYLIGSIIAIPIALMLPVTIYYYSEEIKSKTTPIDLKFKDKEEAKQVLEKYLEEEKTEEVKKNNKINQ